MVQFDFSRCRLAKQTREKVDSSQPLCSPNKQKNIWTNKQISHNNKKTGWEINLDGQICDINEKSKQQKKQISDKDKRY
jgi:hypothetical protein